MGYFTYGKQQRIYYQEAHDHQGTPILLLHGWGGESASFQPVFNYLRQYFPVYAFDLPGFGKSDQPAEVWGVEEYAACVVAFVQEKQLDKVHLVGHSHGGRVSIYLASHYPELVKRIVLVDSAGLIPKRHLNYYLKVYTYKLAKKMYLSPLFPGTKEAKEAKLLNRFGSNDYKQAGTLRKTFVKLVNQDLRPLLTKVKAPTLLIWGENDPDTPLYMGKIMEQEIPDAALIVFEGAGHFSYLDDIPRFNLIVSNFFANT